MKSEIRQIPLSAIEANDGQLSGVPRNPRRFAPDKMRLLRKSIKEDPEMLDFRPLVVFPHAGKYVVIGGNMRLAALRELGYMQAPCAALPQKNVMPQKNVILFDDIVTTFSTITASRAVLTGKNVFCLVAINNNR